MFKIRDKNFTFNDIAIYTYMAIFNKDNGLMNENGLTECLFWKLRYEYRNYFHRWVSRHKYITWKILYELLKKLR